MFIANRIYHIYSRSRRFAKVFAGQQRGSND